MFPGRKMVTEEEWLSSRLKLCSLTSSSLTCSDNVQGPMEVAVDTQSCPRPVYDQSSILTSLEAYTRVLSDACGKNSLQRGEKRDRKLNLEQSPTDVAAVHHFAQALVGDILRSATHQREPVEARETPPTYHGEGHHYNCMPNIADPSTGARPGEDPDRWPRGHSGQEMLAERLASEVCTAALEAAVGHGSLSSASDARFQVLRSGVEDNGVVGGRRGDTEASSSPGLPGSRRRQDEAGLEADAELWDDDGTRHPDRRLWNASAKAYYSGPATSSSPLCCLAQTGLSSLGSLDYPDAPPSTPLLPEMIKSRASFTRKLKGGLAKEFLPSPPPPTPKDHQDHPTLAGTAASVDEKAEFVVRLMRSLSLECSKRGELGSRVEDALVEMADNDGGLENQTGPNAKPKLTDYAARLSADIVGWVSASRFTCPAPGTNGERPAGGLQLIADAWAEQIVKASFSEMMGNELRERARDEPPQKAPGAPTGPSANSSRRMEKDGPPGVALQPGVEDVTLALSPAVQPQLKQGSQAVPAAEELRALAGALIADTLVQALAELGEAAFDPGAGPCGRGPEPEPWQERPAGGAHRPRENAIQPPGATDCRPSHGEAGTPHLHGTPSAAVHSFAQDFARDVMVRSVQEATRYLIGHGQESGVGVGMAPKGPGLYAVRGLLGGQACDTMRELQGALLWAAASQMESPTLHLILPDTHLQSQFDSVAHIAHLIGWTVGDLMTSLLQHCEWLQAANRGRRESSVSLLGHLLQQLGGNEDGQSQETKATESLTTQAHRDRNIMP